MTKKCALVVGHSSDSQGAQNSATKLTEFQFNDELAGLIKQKVSGVDVEIVYRDTYNQLPAKINALKPDFVVSLHCNAFDGKASGTEVLYYHRSSDGQACAGMLQNRLVEALGLRNRGVRPKSVEDRGGYLLRNAKDPCIISEPFFIDNDDDLRIAQDKKEELVNAYARAIEEMAGVN
jgi:N-acetylmuramoyl-L-alanine amidase